MAFVGIAFHLVVREPLNKLFASISSLSINFLGVLSSELAKSILLIKKSRFQRNMSNKSGLSIEPCGIPDKISGHGL